MVHTHIHTHIGYIRTSTHTMLTVIMTMIGIIIKNNNDNSVNTNNTTATNSDNSNNNNNNYFNNHSDINIKSINRLIKMKAAAFSKSRLQVSEMYLSIYT